MADGRAVAGKMDDGLVAPPPAFADPGRRDKLTTGFAEVDRVVAEFQERERVPGVAYGVVVDGELAHQGGVGVRDHEGGASADADWSSDRLDDQEPDGDVRSSSCGTRGGCRSTIPPSITFPSLPCCRIRRPTPRPLRFATSCRWPRAW